MRYSAIIALGLTACFAVNSSDDDDDGDDDDDAGEEGGGVGSGWGSGGGSGEEGGGTGGESGGSGEEGGGSGESGGSGEEGGGSGGGSGSTDWSAVEGSTFRVDLTKGDWEEPAGLGSLLAEQMEQDQLWYVSDQSGSSIELLVGHTIEGGSSQDECVPTLELDGGVDGAWFEVGGKDIEWNLGDGMGFRMERYTLRGEFDSDGSEMIDGEWQATMDFRSNMDIWGELLGSEDPQEMCDLMGGFGVSCEACDDGKEYCVDYLVTGLTGSGGYEPVYETDGC